MTNLKIALDWTPNINHIGILIAKERGYYQESNIDLEIVSPLDDNYQLTPGKKLELDLVDFAIAPFETVISLNNKTNKVDAIAIYAILQEDISSIASLKSKNLTSPSMLDNRIYASYKARYEDKIIQELVKNDGGSGHMKITYPDKLGIWNTLIKGKADATWIFDNWEGVETESKGIELNKWSLKDYGIPYGYSPTIITKRDYAEKHEETVRNFTLATQKGYLFALEDESKSVDILKSYLTEYDKNNIDIKKALTKTKDLFAQDKIAGLMDPKKVDLFINWLIDKKLESDVIKQQSLFTNKFIQ